MAHGEKFHFRRKFIFELFLGVKETAENFTTIWTQKLGQ